MKVDIERWRPGGVLVGTGRSLGGFLGAEAQARRSAAVSNAPAAGLSWRRYRARHRDPTGRTRSVTFDRLEDARRFLAGLGGDLWGGDYIDLAQARARFEDWAEATRAAI